MDVGVCGRRTRPSTDKELAPWLLGLKLGMALGTGQGSATMTPDVIRISLFYYYYCRIVLGPRKRLCVGDMSFPIYGP